MVWALKGKKKTHVITSLHLIHISKETLKWTKTQTHTYSVSNELVMENRRIGVDLNPIDCYKSHGNTLDRKSAYFFYVKLPELTWRHSPMVGTSDINTRLMELATLFKTNKKKKKGREILTIKSPQKTCRVKQTFLAAFLVKRSYGYHP